MTEEKKSEERKEEDPETGELVQGDAKAQAKCAMENLKAVIESADYTIAVVVKTTIYLIDAIVCR